MTLYFYPFKPFISLLNSKIILSHKETNKETKKSKNEKKLTISQVVYIVPNSLKMKNKTMKNRCLKGRTNNKSFDLINNNL